MLLPVILKVSRHLVDRKSSITAGTDLHFCQEGPGVSAGFMLMPNLFLLKLQRDDFGWENFHEDI